MTASPHDVERHEAPIRSWREIVGDIRMLKIKIENASDIDPREAADVINGLADVQSDAEHYRDRAAEAMAAWERDGCSTADEAYDTLRKLAMEDAL